MGPGWEHQSSQDWHDWTEGRYFHEVHARTRLQDNSPPTYGLVRATGHLHLHIFIYSICLHRQNWLSHNYHTFGKPLKRESHGSYQDKNVVMGLEPMRLDSCLACSFQFLLMSTRFSCQLCQRLNSRKASLVCQEAKFTFQETSMRYNMKGSKRVVVMAILWSLHLLLGQPSTQTSQRILKMCEWSCSPLIL